MKKLTLALLFSIAPAVIKAESKPCLLDIAPTIIEDANKCGSCDRTEQIENERCCNLTELVLLDPVQAVEATTVTVTISGENITAEGWDFINNYVPAVYGLPTTIDAHVMNWVFERGDRSLAEWFTFLASVEAIFVAVQSTVIGTCTDAATVSLNLN